MYFSRPIVFAALLASFAVATPLVAAPGEKDHSTPPGHVNLAPYGHPDTYFHGLKEAQDLNKTLQARGAAGVYWCTEEEFKGGCHYTIASGGACHPWTSGIYSSFGPDPGITCAMFQGPNCGMKMIGNIKNPGWAHVEDWVDNRNDPWTLWVPQSFRCHWT